MASYNSGALLPYSAPPPLKSWIRPCHHQRITIVLETFHDVAVDRLESLGAWLGLGGILSTVVENPPARNNELHVNIRPPCRELQGVVAVQQVVISLSHQGGLAVNRHNTCHRLQVFRIAEPTLQHSILLFQAVRS